MKSKEEEVKAQCTPAVVSDVQVCTKLSHRRRRLKLDVLLLL